MYNDVKVEKKLFNSIYIDLKVNQHLFFNNNNKI